MPRQENFMPVNNETIALLKNLENAQSILVQAFPGNCVMKKGHASHLEQYQENDSRLFYNEKPQKYYKFQRKTQSVEK